MENRIDETRDYLDRVLDRIVDGLPAFLGAVLVFLIGYLVAKLLEGLVGRALTQVNLNQRLRTGQGGNLIQRAIPNPSGVLARFVFWAVFLFGISIAISVLGVPVLNDLVRSIYGYLPNVIAALLIFMVASAISAAVAALVRNTMGDTPTGRVVTTATPVVVMSLAMFMILNQLKIAPTIVTITYAAIVGSVSLGMALAFGLGGRDVAARMLQNMYEKGQVAKEQAKRDTAKGVAVARSKVNRRLR
jgi:hypothetical protein